MFSGIVQELGKVLSNEVSAEGGSAKLIVEAGMYASGAPAPEIGDSVLHNGVCLTVVKLVSREAGSGVAEFDVSSETLRATTLGKLSVGDEINLETSKRLGDSLDGHLVLGHVDDVARVTDVRQEEETWRVEFSVSSSFASFIAEKGSVTLDGVSLTVGELRDEPEVSFFSVYIIPHTWEVTTFKNYQSGSLVNLEVDVLARYAGRILEYSSRIKAQ